ncbi:MAG TPA: hypothetical protein VJZ71_21360 [Phycisphaerae bacterium]|nr:hypothetical protein [Phycisphaerae bacterium]
MYPYLSPEVFDREQQDRALLSEAQRVLVGKIIAQSSKAEDLTEDLVRTYSAAIARFQRIDVARERNDLARRRIDARYTIARAHHDTQLEVARIRAEAARRRPNHPQVDEYDDEAPFGRDKDGRPYTEAEFDQSLNQAIRDIWGLKPINPKSYMPWEMKRAPDGRLVAPDDPSVASNDGPATPGEPAAASADPANGPREESAEPPDVADGAPLRARSDGDEEDDERVADDTSRRDVGDDIRRIRFEASGGRDSRARWDLL